MPISWSGNRSTRTRRYLAKLTLGQFGSELELGMHDWLHMRWASVTRTPPTAPRS